MIHKDTLTTDWIDQISKENRKADKILVEKTIRALLLLEGLSQSGLHFIFKGGTALMLALNTLRRLSIDIDIILTEKHNNLEEQLSSIAQDKGFLRVESQHRSAATSIEKEHYKFYYHPLYATDKEEAILLDILYEDNHYQNVQKQEIKFSFLKLTGDQVYVNLPSVEDLLGDKLTAFAPNTIGIPYYRKDVSMSMEIIKQLYDIGNAFDAAQDLEVIKPTYDTIVKNEMEYCGMRNGIKSDILDDTYQTALCLSLRGTIEKGTFDHLQSGIQRVSQFIFSEPFQIEKAIVAASKAAYLTRLIATDQKVIEKYEGPHQIGETVIEDPHNTKLNKLKRSNPEAFFYWWKATQLV
jgi:hypothetical protein